MAKQELSNLFVRITADTRQFTGAINRTQRQLTGMTQSVGRLAGAFGLAFGAFGAVRFVKGSVKAFAEQEKAVETLRAALIATGNDGAGALDKITESAVQMQRATTAADEAVIQATATLSQLAPALNADELVRAQNAMIGLAETFTDGNIESAAVAIGKSLGGTVDLLARWGVGVGTAGTASERLGRLLEKTGKFFEVAKARAQTLDGALRQLGNAYGDLREQVGAVLVQSISFGDNARNLTQVIYEWTAALEQNRAVVVAWIRQIAQGIATAFQLITNLVSIATRAVTSAALNVTLVGAQIIKFGKIVKDVLSFRDIDTTAADARIASLRDALVVNAEGVNKDFDDIGAAIDALFERSVDTAAVQMGRAAAIVQRTASSVQSAVGDLGGTDTGAEGLRTISDIVAELPAKIDAAAGAASQLEGPIAALEARARALKSAVEEAFSIDAETAEASETVQIWVAEFLRLQGILEQVTGTTYNIDLTVNGGAPDAAVSELNQAMQGIVQGLPGQFFNLGLQMMGGMGDGMNAGKSIIFGILQSIINKLIAIAVAKLIIFSPSRLAFGWGENVTKGLALGLASEIPRLERTWNATLDTLTPPGAIDVQLEPLTPPGAIDVQLEPLTQGIEYVRSAVPDTPTFDELQQQVDLFYGRIGDAPELGAVGQLVELVYDQVPTIPALEPIDQLISLEYGASPVAPDLDGIFQSVRIVYDTVPVAPDLDGIFQSVRIVYDTVPVAPDLDPIRQGVDLVYSALPSAPDLDPALQRIEYLRDTLPSAPDLATIDQLIAIEYSTLPSAPDFDPIRQQVDLEYGAMPTTPDIGTVAAPAVSAVPQMDPTINVYVDNLFADPHAEARKVGSQVFLREGFTVARESGYSG